MRIIIDIPKEDIRILSTIAHEKHVSPTELIRQAITMYVAHYHNSPSQNDKAFGLWKKNPRDSLSYQEALRKEWE